jgi:DNA-binding NtrC family response regulator
MLFKILVVDDEPDMLQLLKRSLEPDLNCRVETAASGEAALHLLSSQAIDLVVADIKMPGMDGLELLEIIRRTHPSLTVIMMTAYGQIDMAVEAMRAGAYDFITKPFEYEALILRLEKALERHRLIEENRRLQEKCRNDSGSRQMIGQSPSMQRVHETIQMVAKNDLTVLITGESGTGKDLTARAVHALSHRSKGPFVAVNCPTVPENILESELFGYKKGAFTHATQNRIGLFQEADGGTIFLDEIGDISPAIQTKLLRVLQEKEIKPLGDVHSIQVDVRIVASTNQNLKAKIARQEFREDFFYRLNVLPIHLPPLRDRVQDIPLLVDHLLKKHCRELNKPNKTVAPELMGELQRRHWEGNIRELENVLLQGILFSPEDVIRPRDIELQAQPARAAAVEPEWAAMPYKAAKESHLRHFNHAYIGRVLIECQGNVTQAARMCGLERQALQQIMRRYGIEAEKFRSTTDVL